MRHLAQISIAITALGGCLLLAGWLVLDSPFVILSGALLAIAGGVKIAMVALWHTVANFGAPPAPDDRGSTPAAAAATANRKGS